MNPPTTAWIGLGANLGERAGTLRTALAALAALPGTRLLRVSSLYRSAPVDAGGPDYLNAVAEIATDLPPHDLLAALQAIERAAGTRVCTSGRLCCCHWPSWHLSGCCRSGWRACVGRQLNAGMRLGGVRISDANSYGKCSCLRFIHKR